MVFYWLLLYDFLRFAAPSATLMKCVKVHRPFFFIGLKVIARPSEFFLKIHNTLFMPTSNLPEGGIKGLAPSFLDPCFLPGSHPC